MARSRQKNVTWNQLGRTAVFAILISISSAAIWSSAHAQSIFSPDLVISNVLLSVPQPVPGQFVDVTVVIANNSSRAVPEDLSFIVELLPGKGEPPDSVFVRGGLDPFEAREVNLLWRINSAGEHLLRVNVDPTDNVLESDETNNGFQDLYNATFTEYTGADLVVESFRVSPSNPAAGQIVTLEARIANLGEGDVDLAEVAFQSDGELIGKRSIFGLAAGTSTLISMIWTAEAADRILRVKVDPDGLIPEVEEENNAASLSLDLHPGLSTCGQSAWIDLRAEGIPILTEITGLIEEELLSSFMPKIKRVMEQQFEGINLKFTLSRPIGSRAQVVFNAAERGSILGQAPLGARFSAGFVYLGSFLSNASLAALPESAQAIVLATVASHELGHLLGLPHTSQGQGSDIMAANADLSPAVPSAIPQFSSDSRIQLERLLPLSCF